MDRNSLIKSLQSDRIKKLQSSTKQQLPSNFTMAKNLAGSVVRNVASVASGNSLNISQEEANRRLSICNGCEFFIKESQRCSKCGCNMAIKTYLKAERCPVGKW